MCEEGGGGIYFGALLSHVFNCQAFIDDNVGMGHMHCLKKIKNISDYFIFFIRALDWARGRRTGAIAPPWVYLCTPLCRGVSFFTKYAR